MPSTFSHAIAAVALGKAYTNRRLPLRFWIISAICAIAPDLDVSCTRLGISYTDMLGHRGFTHSFFFAALLAGLVVLMAFRQPIEGINRRSFFVYFFLVTISHAILDALVDGTLGVAFFAPFSSNRYFLPWRPIRSSPIGLNFFSAAGATTIMNEFFWVWIPSLTVILAPWLRRLFSSVRSAGRSRESSLSRQPDHVVPG